MFRLCEIPELNVTSKEDYKNMKSYPDLSALKDWHYAVDENESLRGGHLLDEQKPTINFLHGNGLCGKTYWSMLKGLSDDYSLFLQDCVGHGDSDEGAGFVSWEKSAEDAYQIILAESGAAKGKRALVGMGHSFGGILTLKIAAKYPELFDALVLLDPIMMPEEFMAMSKDMPNPLAAKTRVRRNNWTSKQEAMDYFRSKSAYKNWSDESLRNFVNEGLLESSEGGLSLKCPPAVEADIFSSTPDGLWDDVRGLTVPTIIMFGDSSYPFMESACQQASKNKNISIEKVSGSHCFMLEHEEMAQDKIKAHLKKMLA